MPVPRLHVAKQGGSGFGDHIEKSAAGCDGSAGTVRIRCRTQAESRCFTTSKLERQP